MSSDERKAPRGLDFNPDPHWQKWVYDKYKSIIEKISYKYCTSDPDLREDVAQEAMIALMTIRLEDVKGYGDFQSGVLSEKEWNRKLDNYLRQVARNSVITLLTSTTAGNWYTGRKRRRKNPLTGESEYVSTPATYVPLDSILSANNRIQIGTDGVIHIEGALARQSITDALDRDGRRI